MALLGAFSLWWSIRFARIDVARAEVVGIEIDPYPEGPDSPPFVRGPTEPGEMSLSLIEDSIPVPLPAPKWQGFFCRLGSHVSVQLADGRTIKYGPCRRPDSIEQLRQRMIDVLDER